MVPLSCMSFAEPVFDLPKDNCNSSQLALKYGAFLIVCISCSYSMNQSPTSGQSQEQEEEVTGLVCQEDDLKDGE